MIFRHLSSACVFHCLQQKERHSRKNVKDFVHYSLTRTPSCFCNSQTLLVFNWCKWFGWHTKWQTYCFRIFSPSVEMSVKWLNMQVQVIWGHFLRPSSPWEGRGKLTLPRLRCNRRFPHVDTLEVMQIIQTRCHGGRNKVENDVKIIFKKMLT